MRRQVTRQQQYSDMDVFRDGERLAKEDQCLGSVWVRRTQLTRIGSGGAIG